jgi:D-alanine-D-alanine ligase
LETAHPFYNYAAKYQATTTRYHCPCGLSVEREQALQQLALQAAETIGVCGWGRVDVFIDADDQAQLIEVNTVPGMTDHSLVPMAAAKLGIDFGELVWRILETSMT